MTSQPFAFFTSDPTQMQDYLNQVIGSGSSADDVQQVRDLVKTKVLPLFNNMLMSTLMLNTTYNSTRYITDDVQQKQEDATQKEQRTRNNISKVRYNYVQKKYIVAYRDFVSRCLQGAIIVTAFSAIVIGMWFQKTFSAVVALIIVGVIVSIYLLIIAVLVSHNQFRRKDDWTKFYFSPYDPANYQNK